MTISDYQLNNAELVAVYVTTHPESYKQHSSDHCIFGWAARLIPGLAANCDLCDVHALTTDLTNVDHHPYIHYSRVAVMAALGLPNLRIYAAYGGALDMLKDHIAKAWEERQEMRDADNVFIKEQLQIWNEQLNAIGDPVMSGGGEQILGSLPML